MPQTPCHGDVFHILHQFEQVANSLKRKAQGATTQRLKLKERLAKCNSTTQTARAKHLNSYPVSMAYFVLRVLP